MILSSTNTDIMQSLPSRPSITNVRNVNESISTNADQTIVSVRTGVVDTTGASQQCLTEEQIQEFHRQREGWERRARTQREMLERAKKEVENERIKLRRERENEKAAIARRDEEKKLQGAS